MEFLKVRRKPIAMTMFVRWRMKAQSAFACSDRTLELRTTVVVDFGFAFVVDPPCSDIDDVLRNGDASRNPVQFMLGPPIEAGVEDFEDFRGALETPIFLKRLPDVAVPKAASPAAGVQVHL